MSHVMSHALEDAARAALRRRQGAGARYDSPAAPARELAWARRGTAYFARKLNELEDGALDAPSRAPGWMRRHVIAHVGYHARALARLVEGARTGVEAEMYPSAAARDAEIADGATLPARALRTLFHHAEVHLNVEWRDLTDAGWDVRVRPLDGAAIAVRRTAWMRGREIWTSAVDLDNGGAYGDFPPDLVDALIADAVDQWSKRAPPAQLVLAPEDRGGRITLGDGGGPIVSGRAANIARWLLGRGARGLRCSIGEPPPVPPLP